MVYFFFFTLCTFFFLLTLMFLSPTPKVGVKFSKAGRLFVLSYQLPKRSAANKGGIKNNRRASLNGPLSRVVRGARLMTEAGGIILT